MKEVMKLTVFESEVILSVLNMRGNRANGCSYKTLKNIHSIVTTIKAALPGLPERPLPPKPEKEGDKLTKEQQEQYLKDSQKWSEDLDARQNQEIEVELFNSYKELIKNKLQEFNGFLSDEAVREKIIKLGDKLGLQ